MTYEDLVLHMARSMDMAHRAVSGEGGLPPKPYYHPATRETWRPFREGDQVEAKSSSRLAYRGTIMGTVVATTPGLTTAVTVQVLGSQAREAVYNPRRLDGSIWEEAPGEWFYRFHGEHFGPFPTSGLAKDELLVREDAEFKAMTEDA